MKIAVIGGDARQIYAAAELRRRGLDTALWGLDGESSECSAAVTNAISGADAVLLPMPMAGADGLLNAPLSAEKVSIKELPEQIAGVPLVMAGKAEPAFADACTGRGTVVVDYSERGEITVSGAIATAEAAICELIRYTGRAVHKSRILVIGGGRIGCRLARILDSLGADVTITARKEADILRLRSEGYDTIRTKDIEERCDEYDAILNTVPAETVSIAAAKRMGADCFLLDLASKPGGVKEETAGLLGKRYKAALGLPGKYQPKTAGLAVAEAVFNIIKERNQQWEK